MVVYIQVREAGLDYKGLRRWAPDLGSSTGSGGYFLSFSRQNVAVPPPPVGFGRILMLTSND